MAKENEATPERSAPATPLRRGIRCASGAGVALGLVLVSTCCPGFSLRHTWGRLSEQYRLGADGHGREPGVPLSSFRDGSRAFSPSASQGSPRVLSAPLISLADTASEAEAIQPIDIPFIQDPEKWREPGNGISLDALGEPKSGTTWLGRLVPQLALDLCGSWNNLWCEMGGLAITDRVPAPSYEFEMISKKNTSDFINEETGEPGVGEKTLFLHYQNKVKHVIPGMDLHEPESRKRHSECNYMGWPHNNGFHDVTPCTHGEGRRTPTRERLEACLWSTAEECREFMTSADPAVRRSFVIFRDPRDVIISEYKMRTAVFESPLVMGFSSLDEFIQFKFEVLVSWIHQRWVWHSGDFMGPSSYLVYYEEAQESPLQLVGMANFMGLECSEDQAFQAWKAHENTSPHGDYTTHGLEVQTIEYMNATMANLLPPSLALRYGINPTYL